MNGLQLLDLPPVWLGSMVLAIEPGWYHKGHRALFRACSKFQQLIFHQPAIRPRLSVDPEGIERLGCPLFARALAMAEAAGTKLHLHLEGICPNSLALSLLFTSVAFFQPAQQPQQSLASFQITCVTAVSMFDDDEAADHELDCMLPDVLVKHCPNLQELKLQNFIVADHYSAPQLTCTSLQKLSLSVMWQLGSEGFKQHLLNLPSLTALDLSQTGEAADYEEGGVFWAAIARYSSQLRAISCYVEGQLQCLPWSPTTYLPLLQELKLDMELEGDAVMQQLLTTTPNLKHIRLHSITGLTSSFLHLPCCWQELRLVDVHVAELAKLPLSSCTRLEYGSRMYMRCRDEQPSPEQFTAGVNAVQAAGGVLQIGLYPDDVERLTAAAPLLQHTKLVAANVELLKPDGNAVAAPWSDWRPLLAALGQHLKCETVSLNWNGWADSPGALAQVPELLPHVGGFTLWPKPPEAELVHMMRTANRPFTLSPYYVSDSPKERLQQVVQEAGHQLVTLK